MARYRQYNRDEADSDTTLRVIDSGFHVFLMRNCDDAVLGDLETVQWFNDQGAPIHVDIHFWSNPVNRSRHGNDYPHAAVVDALDSAVLLIRDPDLGMAFKLKFC